MRVGCRHLLPSLLALCAQSASTSDAIRDSYQVKFKVFFITAVKNRGKSGGRKVDPMEALEDPESSPSLTGGLTYLPTVAGSALPSALYVNTISNMYYTYMPPPHPSQPLVCLFTQPTPTFCTAHTSQHDCNLLTRLPQLNLTCASDLASIG